jgi:hypothetical protein
VLQRFDPPYPLPGSRTRKFLAQIVPAPVSDSAAVGGPEVVRRMIPSYPAGVCEMNMEPERAGLVFGGWDVCENAGEYRPRRPEESVLYGVVAGHIETFLARQRERDRLVPRFVEREFRSFLD